MDEKRKEEWGVLGTWAFDLWRYTQKDAYDLIFVEHKLHDLAERLGELLEGRQEELTQLSHKKLVELICGTLNDRLVDIQSKVDALPVQIETRVMVALNAWLDAPLKPPILQPSPGESEGRQCEREALRQRVGVLERNLEAEQRKRRDLADWIDNRLVKLEIVPPTTPNSVALGIPELRDRVEALEQSAMGQGMPELRKQVAGLAFQSIDDLEKMKALEEQLTVTVGKFGDRGVNEPACRMCQDTGTVIGEAAYEGGGIRPYVPCPECHKGETP